MKRFSHNIPKIIKNRYNLFHFNCVDHRIEILVINTH